MSRRAPIIKTSGTVRLTMTTVILLIFLTVVVIISSNNGGVVFVHAQYQRQQQTHNQDDPAVKCQPVEPIKYDWERYNYYELLGIPNAFNKYIKDDGTGNNKQKKKKKRRLGKGGDNEINDDGEMMISNKDIRKAYRKTAQQYHPDKVSNKKNSGNNNNSTNVSIEESNSRFTKIAEAYEFLSDHTKQQEYNLFLEYCHNLEVANGVHIEDTDQEGGGRISTMLRKRFNTV